MPRVRGAACLRYPFLLLSKMNFVNAAEGTDMPDGMNVDVEGKVYCAGPGGVWLWRPAAGILARS